MNKCFWLLNAIIFSYCGQQKTIDREALVRRHTIHIQQADSLSSLSIGNGNFAFTVDVTGLQSFPDYYKGGVPLGTQATWGWHSFPNAEAYRLEESLRNYELAGRTIPYPVQWKEHSRNREAADYFRQNPHRLQLGSIGLYILMKDGREATIQDIKAIDQQLDMWTGEIRSRFTVDSDPVEVVTYAHQQQDMMAVRIQSPLISQERLQVRISFPYPSNQFKDVGRFEQAGDFDKHVTQIEKESDKHILLSHTLDTTKYYLQVSNHPSATVRRQPGTHRYDLIPAEAGDRYEGVFLFTPAITDAAIPSFAETQKNSGGHWQQFWKSGGAVDLSGSKDSRANELERRIVLSQYLTKLQCAADLPPQETGLTFNSWYGKPHLEMHWWHAVHFALWGRPELMEKSMDWYFTATGGARKIAERQGFEGIRWQKMTEPAGEESPSSVGSFLIWQQPHIIYMAELLYRDKKSKQVLEKYKDIIFATADFMASYPAYDSVNKRYNLGPGLIPAQECFDPLTTYNPTYELAYWHWALNVAQEWRERLGMPRNKKWDDVLQNLAALPQANGVYLATESTPDCYTTDRYKTDHPAVLAAYSTIPAANHLDTAVMNKTFDLVWQQWQWEETWGWDFPLTAMAATRLHKPEKAIDALFMPVQTNTYLVNGHNYQDGRLTIYLPGNGGLLSAIALMCAGYDGAVKNNPGFPADGNWTVRWEGLRKMF